MWKDIFEAYIRINIHTKVQLIAKLDVLSNAGELADGEYQEILIIINKAYPE